MFPFEDNRTPKERERDLRFAEEREARAKLAVGFADIVRQKLSEGGCETGFVEQDLGRGCFLVRNGDVQYKIHVSVSRDDF